MRNRLTAIRNRVPRYCSLTPVVVAVAALAGMAANTLSLPAGSGMTLLAGNVFLVAILRLAPAPPVIAAAVITGSPLWWLWGDPVQWAVSIGHIAAVALLRTRSPIVSTLVFCLTFGAVLNFAGYAPVSQWNVNIAWASWAGSAYNCLVVATFGELLGLALLRTRWGARIRRRKVGLEAILVTSVTVTLMVPSAGFWMVQFPLLEVQGYESSRTRALALHNKIADQMALWTTANARLLKGAAATLVGGRVWSNTNPHLNMVRTVTVIDRQGAVRATTGRTARVRWPEAALAAAETPDGVRLTRIAGPDGGAPSLRLVVPAQVNGEGLVAVGDINEAELNAIIPVNSAASARMIVERASGYAVGNLDNPLLRRAAAERADMLARPEITESRIEIRNSAAPTFLHDSALSLLTGSSMETPQGWSILTTEQISAVSGTGLSLATKLMVARLLVAAATIALAAALARLVANLVRHQVRSAAEMAALGESPLGIDRWTIDELDDLPAFFASARDVRSADKERELRLRQKVLNIVVGKLRHVAYSALYFPDGTFRLEYLSDNVESVLGYPHDELLTEAWTGENVHPDDVAMVQWEADHDINLGREYRVRHRDGHYLWVERTRLYSEPVPEADAHRVIGILVEVTDRKLARDRAIHLDKLASLGRMASGIAHELNQPLNFVRMAAFNLREGLKSGRYSPDQTNEKLAAILRQVERAGAIIQHMRRFGQSTSATTAPVALRAAIDQAMELVGGQLVLANIVVDVSGCPDTISAKASPLLLEQVLLNLVLNARDAICRRVEREPEPPGEITITAAQEGDHVVLAIADNGTGIPADHLPKLFEPFFTTKAPNKGMGLGLSISFDIIQSMGGELRAANGEQGACFEIRLPAAHATDSAA